jgi:hypothetical protein
LVISTNKDVAPVIGERDDCSCQIEFLISDALNENSQLSYVAKCRHCPKLEKVKELVLEQELKEVFEKIADLRKQLGEWREDPLNLTSWMDGYGKALYDISQTLNKITTQEGER